MNLKYPLYNLNYDDFEKLAALICERILGTGTIVFSKGKDGGRDGKFTGKANKFPSKVDPWDGKFIVQAKHTTNPVDSCSSSRFQTILKEELPKLRKLKEQDKIDFYIIFTNRKLSGLQDPKIEDLLDEKIGTSVTINKRKNLIDLVSRYSTKFQYDETNKCLIYYGEMAEHEKSEYINKDMDDQEKIAITTLFSCSKKEIKTCVIGDERIHLWLQEYPEIAKTLGLKKLLMPLEFYEKDLQEIVIAFSEVKISKEKMKAIHRDLKRLSMVKKNKLNNLGKDYFDSVFKNSYSDFNKIKSFLEDPINEEYKSKYDNTVSDLQEEITIRRNEYSFFEEILNYLYKMILDLKNDKLLTKRKLIRVFLHYMYFNCDIGKRDSENA